MIWVTICIEKIVIDYGPGALQHLHTPHEMLHSIISHLLQLDRRSSAAMPGNDRDLLLRNAELLYLYTFERKTEVTAQ